MTSSDNPNWQNKEFLQEQPLDLDRLRNPESTESLLIVRPNDLERPEVCKQIHTALQKKDRILLFKAFFADEEELLAWGREPAQHFDNAPYLFDVPTVQNTAKPDNAMDRSPSSDPRNGGRLANVSWIQCNSGRK